MLAQIHTPTPHCPLLQILSLLIIHSFTMFLTTKMQGLGTIRGQRSAPLSPGGKTHHLQPLMVIFHFSAYPAVGNKLPWGQKQVHESQCTHQAPTVSTWSGWQGDRMQGAWPEQKRNLSHHQYHLGCCLPLFSLSLVLKVIGLA